MIEQRYQFMSSVCSGWIGKLDEGRKARKEFDEIAHQCDMFYRGAVNCMYDERYIKTFINGKLPMKFKVMMQNLFVYMTVVGPALYWQNAARMLEPVVGEPLDLQSLAQVDPEIAMAMQFLGQQDAAEDVYDEARRVLMHRYLNYTPREMPGGGLRQHSQLSITQAAVSGRGLLEVKQYQPPGSEHYLTGCFFRDNRDLIIDPDAKSVDTALWVALECHEPVWQVERDRNLAPGSLQKYATDQSANAKGESGGDYYRRHKQATGKSNDMIRYWKVYSKMGVGTRLSGVDSPLHNHFERVIGDYAYIEVARECPFPLNATTGDLMESANDGEVQAMLRWPLEFWRDSRWPVTFIDFYRVPGRAYPLPPAFAAIGPITYLNLYVSQMMGRAWSSRPWLAYLESAKKVIESAQYDDESDTMRLPLPPIFNDISKLIQLFQSPGVTADQWQIVEFLTAQIEKALGLPDILQGFSDTQSRSAADATYKQQGASIRPRFMREEVNRAMAEAADMEKFAARMYVTGKCVRPMMGARGEYLWDRLITTQPVELVVRNMKATVDAASSRPPNRERDTENVNTTIGVLFPELSKHADATGDTGPLNKYLQVMGESYEMDALKGIQLGPRVPMPPPPEQQQAMQQQAQLEMAKLQADASSSQSKAEIAKLGVVAKQIENQGKMIEAQARAAEAQEQEPVDDSKQRMKALDMLLQRASHAQEMRHEEEDHQQQLRHEAEEHRQKIVQESQAGAVRLKQEKQRGDLQQQTQTAMAKAKVKAAASTNGRPKAGSKA